MNGFSHVILDLDVFITGQIHMLYLEISSAPSKFVVVMKWLGFWKRNMHCFYTEIDSLFIIPSIQYLRKHLKAIFNNYSSNKFCKLKNRFLSGQDPLLHSSTMGVHFLSRPLRHKARLIDFTTFWLHCFHWFKEGGEGGM